MSEERELCLPPCKIVRWALAAAGLLFITGAVPNGQAPASVAARPALAEPSIAADGSEIAFVSGGDIWTVAAGGGQARLLISHAANDTHPVFSPDKSRVAFVSTRTGNGDIYLLTLATGDVRRLTFGDALEQLDGWSRDGKWVYFSSSARDLANGVNDVYRVSSDGGTPMPVSGDRYANEYFSAASPDGRLLALSARGIASGQWWRHGHSHIDEAEIWIRDLTAGDVPAAWRALTNGGAKELWPMWAADGKSLLYVSDRSGAENIWQTPVAAGPPRQLTRFTDGRVLWPSITDRGDVVVFERNFEIWKLEVASGRTSAVSIARIGAPAGPAVEHLRLTSQFGDLVLSPDGRKVAFTARGEVFAAAAKDGGDAARVTMTPAAEAQLAWSPDSRRLVYSSERDGAPRLVIYDFTTSTETPLTAATVGDYAPQFSPDGKSIAFVRGGTELRVIDVASRQERVLAKGIIADTVGVGLPLAWSPDSRWLAYFSAGTRGFTNVSIVAAAGGGGPPGQLPRQRQCQRDHLVARRHVPRVRHRPADRANRARTPRPDAAHAEIPRGSVPRPVQRGEHAGQSAGSHGAAAARPRRRRRRLPPQKRKHRQRQNHPPNPRAHAANRPQSPWRSSSRTSAAGSRWCRPASTSARRSSARTARPRC